MKRLLVLVLALAFLLPGCSSGGGKSNLKTYDTGLGLELQLPAGFEKFDSEDFAYAISNEDNVNLDSAKMVVFVNYEGDDTLRAQGVEYRNLKEYGEAVSEGDNIKTSAGMVGDRYIFDYDYEEYYYKIVCLQGNDGFYIVNFCCFNDSKDLPKRFDEFAQGVKVKSIDQQPDHTTFTNSHFTIDLPNVFTEDADSVDHSADYAYLSYDIVDKELFDSWGYEYPENNEKAVVEAIRKLNGDEAFEIKQDGDLYYYVYTGSDYSNFITVRKASDSYLYCEGITYADCESMLIPAFIKWFKSIKVNF